MSDVASLVVERVLHAGPDDVFDAWVEPEMLREWMSPDGHAEADVDAREGGRFTIVMVGDEMRIEHTGEYLVVDRPRRLSFTWSSPYAPASVVTVTFAPHDDGTFVRLVHERLPGEHVAGHEGGWGTMFDRLATLLADRGAPA